MTTGEKVVQALTQSAEERRSAEQPGVAQSPYHFTHEGEPQLELSVLQFSGVGGAFDRVQLKWSEPLEFSQVRQFAERLAERVGYLLEDLTIVEVDEEPSRVLLRSQPEDMKDRHAPYFEVRIDGGQTVTVQRFQSDPQTKDRRLVPMQLTGEALAKLINDLITAESAAQTSPKGIRTDRTTGSAA